MDRGLIEQEVRAAKTGVPFTALGVEDPEGRPLARRPVPIAGDQGLRALADDVPPEPDPGPPGEFQAQAGRLGHGGRQAAGGTGCLEHDEDGVRPTSEGGQATEPIRDTGRAVHGGEPATGQVQEEQVHGTAGQQAAGDGQPFVQRRRRDDDEPFEVDAAGNGLHRVERPGEIQPGHDRTLGLRFGRDPEREGGPAAGAVAADGDAGGSGQAAGAQDRIECREASADDAVVVRARVVAWVVLWLLPGEWRDGERSHDLRSCRSPASLEGRHGCRHVRGKGRHRTVRIEHPFY
jgi:hypothetical protein